MAQALFGNPDILLLDEPTNHLDVDSILWLEEFLLDFPNTVVVVSHDRHFLDKVCTHIADIDFGKVTLYSGNYTFWYETSQMALGQRSASNKKKEEQIAELKSFIARFSANASKSRQASSRKKLLDKITLDDIRPSSRKYPFIQFKAERALGKEVVTVEGLRKTIGGDVLFDGLSFSIGRGERVALVGDDRVISALFDILAGESKPDAGSVTWGRSAQAAYFPKESNAYFATSKSVLDWLRQYAPDSLDETHIRSFLGRMLFTSDEVHKKVGVLSGGERVRCMLSRLMLQDPNTLLLNQPTNHLDLESITALNNGLLKSEVSMIFSCHDVQFVESLANRVIELSGNTYLRPPHELLGLSRRRRETGPGRPARGVSKPPYRQSGVLAAFVAGLVGSRTVDGGEHAVVAPAQDSPLALAAVVDPIAGRARRGEWAVGAVAESTQRRPGSKVLGQGPAMLVQLHGELAADEADVPRFRAVPSQTLFAERIAEHEPVLVRVRGQPLYACRRGQPQIHRGAELVLAVARACGSAPLLRRPKDARLLAVRPKCGVDADPEPSGPGARQQRAEGLGRLGFDAVFAARARVGGVVQSSQRARRRARADRKTARRVDPGEATGRSGCGRRRR